MKRSLVAPAVVLFLSLGSPACGGDDGPGPTIDTQLRQEPDAPSPIELAIEQLQETFDEHAYIKCDCVAEHWWGDREACLIESPSFDDLTICVVDALEAHEELSLKLLGCFDRSMEGYAQCIEDLCVEAHKIEACAAEVTAREGDCEAMITPELAQAIDDCTPGAPDTEDCESNADCDAGQVCADGYCTYDMWADECRVDSDCTQGAMCVDGWCETAR